MAAVPRRREESHFPTLAGQRVRAATPAQGTLVQIPAGPPRLVGIVEPPCQLNMCLGVLGVRAAPTGMATIDVLARARTDIASGRSSGD